MAKHFWKCWYAAVRWLNRCQSLWKIRASLWGLSTSAKAACRTAADGLASSQQAQITVPRAARGIGLGGCGEERQTGAGKGQAVRCSSCPNRHICHVRMLLSLWSKHWTLIIFAMCWLSWSILYFCLRVVCFCCLKVCQLLAEEMN